MKILFQSLRLTLVLLILLSVIYPLSIALALKLDTDKGEGEKLYKNGKVIGYAALGQYFDKPNYFWGRPSATNYNAAGSAGSNKGPTNESYLNVIRQRIDTLIKYHPGLKNENIPADLVTASGSGLDPDISVESAYLQAPRIAKNRMLREGEIKALIAKNVETHLFIPSTINVLKLNLALDNIKK